MEGKILCKFGPAIFASKLYGRKWRCYNSTNRISCIAVFIPAAEPRNPIEMDIAEFVCSREG